MAYVYDCFLINCQCYAEKQALGRVSQEVLDTQVNPAVWEISGHMVLKRRKDYKDASEEYAWRLLSEVSLSKERFKEVKAYILKAASSNEADMMKSKLENEEDAPYKSPTSRAAPHVPQGCMVLH